MRSFDGAIGTVALPGMALVADDAGSAQVLASVDPAQSQADAGNVATATSANPPLAWGPSSDGGVVLFRGFTMPLNAPVWRWVQSLEQRKGRVLDLTQPFRPTWWQAAACSPGTSATKSIAPAVVEIIGDPLLAAQWRAAGGKLRDDNDPTELKSLVLRVTEGYRGNRIAFHRFDVIWVDNFRSRAGSDALSLSTVEASEAAEERPELNINVEAHGVPLRRDP